MQNLAEQVTVGFITQSPQPPSMPGTQFISRSDVVAIHVNLINQLQSRANERGVRTFLYNTLAQNGFVNQGYNDLFNDACVYAGVLLKTGTAGYVERAVSDVLKVEVARAVENNPFLQGYLDQNGMQALHGYRQLGAQISQMVRTAMGGNNTGMMPAGMPTGMPMGAPMGMPTGMPMGGLPGPVGGYNNHYGSSGNMTSMMGGNMSNLMGSTTAYTQQDKSMSSIARPDASASNQGQTPAQFTTMLDTTSETPVAEQAIVTDFRNALNNNTSTVEDVYTRWHDTVIIPVIRLDEVIITNQQPWGVRKMIDAEGYEAMETNSKMKKLHREVTGFYENVENGVSLRDLIEAEEITPETPREQIHLNRLANYGRGADIRAANIRNALIDAKLFNASKTGSRNNAFEVIVDLSTPLDVGAADEVTVLQRLSEAHTMTQFVDILVDLKDSMSVYAWMTLHDKLTAIYNRRLGVAQTGILIDSITEDYEASVRVLSNKLEIVAVDRFRDNVLRMLKNSCIGYALGAEHLDINDLFEWGVCETVSLTYVPIMSEKLNMKLPETYGLLTDAVSNEVFTFFRELARRTARDKSVTRRFIVTMDNIVVELHPNDFDPRALVVSKYHR